MSQNITLLLLSFQPFKSGGLFLALGLYKHRFQAGYGPWRTGVFGLLPQSTEGLLSLGIGSGSAKEALPHPPALQSVLACKMGVVNNRVCGKIKCNAGCWHHRHPVLAQKAPGLSSLKAPEINISTKSCEEQHRMPCIQNTHSFGVTATGSLLRQRKGSMPAAQNSQEGGEGKTVKDKSAGQTPPSQRQPTAPPPGGSTALASVTCRHRSPVLKLQGRVSETKRTQGLWDVGAQGPRLLAVLKCAHCHHHPPLQTWEDTPKQVHCGKVVCVECP